VLGLTRPVPVFPPVLQFNGLSKSAWTPLVLLLHSLPPPLPPFLPPFLPP